MGLYDLMGFLISGLWPSGKNLYMNQNTTITTALFRDDRIFWYDFGREPFVKRADLCFGNWFDLRYLSQDRSGLSNVDLRRSSIGR